MILPAERARPWCCNGQSRIRSRIYRILHTIYYSPFTIYYLLVELTLRIFVERPPAGVYFGLQKGHGSSYETVQTVESKTEDLQFEFSVRVQEGKDGLPNFLGPFVQGPPRERFVYLDIGTCAGQTNTPWSRRLKIPLKGITWQLIEQAAKAASSSKPLETRVPGTGKDGEPSCATVKPFAGWKLSRST